MSYAAAVDLAVCLCFVFSCTFCVSHQELCLFVSLRINFFSALISVVCKSNVTREDRPLLLEENKRIELQQILEIMSIKYLYYITLLCEFWVSHSGSCQIFHCVFL
jgi:hypothetical protein